MAPRWTFCSSPSARPPACGAADDELAGALERAGASVAVARAAAPGQVRTFALTDLAWARAARAGRRGGDRTRRGRERSSTPRWAPRCCGRARARSATTRSTADNRPGRHGLWQRPVERRRLRAGAAARAAGRADAAATPRPWSCRPPVEPSGPRRRPTRDIAADHLRRQSREEGPGPRAGRVGRGTARRRGARRRRRADRAAAPRASGGRARCRPASTARCSAARACT